jgi:hypothetical protein
LVIFHKKQLDRLGGFDSSMASHGIHMANKQLITTRKIHTSIMNSILKLALLGLLAAGVAAPIQLRAQDANAPAAEKKEAGPKKSKTPPIHGKLKAVDNAANTITVGTHTIQITPDTKIAKAGNPATLADGVVGEEVTIVFKPAGDGQFVAAKVHFGPKEGKAEAGKETAKKKGQVTTQ